MYRKFLALLFVVSLGQVTWSASFDEVSETLARAEALYYEADFNKSIELLLRVDKLLQPQADHLQDKVSVKLQLALAYIGLNDNAHGKVYLRELYALDPDYVVDTQRFSPKVVVLAEQAKTEQDEVRCRTVGSDAERQLGMGNAEAVMRLVGPNQGKCAGLASIAASAADLATKAGIDAYKKGEMVDAVEKFRTALQLNSAHELATQYMELTQSKLQLNAERVLLEWRKDFDGGEFVLAATAYRRLVSVSGPAAINQVRAEYRKTLTDLVESWNEACANNDASTMEKIRLRVTELLPEPSIGEDILAKMTTCTSTGCIQMNPQLALARLRSRVDPDFSPTVRSQIKVSPITVRVKLRISATGDVSASEPQGGNALLYSALLNAVDRWKFSPAIVQGEARCVDTEIPIVITLKGN